ncbi:MAG: RHS repeat-associated core domain-containing protein [Deltaproteobacteria bacterium]|nr:RHS repeat-associated core domain-containing protein [Deltaproteobacteria bacterium]
MGRRRLGTSWLYRDNYYDAAGNQHTYFGRVNSISLFFESMIFSGYDRAGLRQRSGRPDAYVGHDIRGRVTSDGDFTYTWDTNDRLTQVQRLTDSATWQFRYDGAGRLRRFQEGGLWHRLVWVDGQLYSEHTGASEGNETTLVRVYHADGVTQYAGAVGTRYRIERDVRGSVRAIVHNGQVAHAWRYDPWGVRSDDGGPVTGVEPRRGFAGYVVHADTGLAFTPARVYQPALRRWLTRDPLGERNSVDGNNLYAYAANDPVNYVDPTGQWVDTIADIGFIAYDIHLILNDLQHGASACARGHAEDLGLDVLGAIIPGVTGLGAANRAAGASAHILGADLSHNAYAAARRSGRYTAEQQIVRDWAGEATHFIPGQRPPFAE